MVEFIRSRKRVAFAAGDLLCVVVANALAVIVRFDFDAALILREENRVLELLVLDLLLTPTAFYACGLYQGYWKYVGLTDMIRLVRAVGYRTVALIVVFYALDFHGLSRAVTIIGTVFLLLLAGGVRLAPRFYSEFFAPRRRPTGRRALIVGAGDTGESLLRELRKSPHLDYNVVGFVDDDREKADAKIHGVAVLGTRAELERLIQDYGVQEVIIAVPNASSRDVRDIFQVCREANVRTRTVPTRGELERGAARVSQIRPVELDDLLGREVIHLDQHQLRHELSGRRILITGAAGSIGRELARQLVSYEPTRLLLLDRSENNLFHLEAELRDGRGDRPIDFIVADILDRARMEELFRETRPEVVFHAAAYKHVPLMESHPIEAIKNNVMATHALAEIASATGVDRFVYISTDKAVRPTSVMGATKRLGERLITSSGNNATRFIAVRFGNVLGSDGSVIPTFRRQIAAGGSVTVTHPEATRYFMTTPEAVQLVLAAAAMGERGQTFLLQMGQPVRIVELARSMIELSGLKPDEDIKIIFTGLRPGEKLHEELKGESEQALPTSNDKIMILSGIVPFDADEWRTLKALEEAAVAGRTEAALNHLQELVDDYIPGDVPLTRAVPSVGPRVFDIGSKRRLDAPA